MLKAILLSLALFLAILSCTKENIPIAPEVAQTAQITPGRIAVSAADGLAKSLTGSTHYQDSVSFYLGDLKASRDFYFIIRNVGCTKIRDLTVASNSPDFAVSPSKFDVLAPDSVAAISTILRISAIHGKALDGVGYTTLMKPDTNSAYVTISGTTSNAAGEDTLTRVTVKTTVNALLMAISLLDSETVVDLLKPDAHANCNEGGIGWARVYTITATAKIVNTGNVSFVISNPEWNLIPVATVLPGDTLALPDKTKWRYSNLMVCLNGANTVSDYSRLQLGDDGAAYFMVSANTFP